MMWRNVVETMRLLEAFLARHETFVFFDTETTGLQPRQRQNRGDFCGEVG